MFTRVMTSVVGIPLVIAVIIIGNPLLKYVIMAASLIALYEFYGVVKKQQHPIVCIGYIAVVIHYLAFDWVMANYFIFISLVTMISLVVLVIRYPKYSIIDVGLTIFPIIYAALLFGYLVLLRNVPNGHFWVWLIAISAWGSDTFAYFTGKSIGKHKLAPVLSPKKTIEGSIGGVVGAGLLAYIYTIIYTQFWAFEVREQMLWIIIAAILGAIISQFGDLAASAVKRYYNQKDYGYILPGHGGILDRCDSLLFVAPVIYMVVSMVQSII
ncbi:MAG: phosphatidate cytidylyltransferase [Cellulosilyticum sp.]|nr:phosphatidate cytidylyltransferase [Cellulosilyticum sp.]